MQNIEIISKYFPELTDTQKMQFSNLQGIYHGWNAKINLISRKDINELYTKHVLHSLAIAKFITFQPGTQIIDLGTGGGFPGIPLAIMFPEANFLLVDSIAKKIKVVTSIIDQLELKNCQAENDRIENIKLKADFYTSRAVSPLKEQLKWINKKVNSKHKHKIKNGLITLKGGDVSQEIIDANISKKKLKLVTLSDYFTEEFFETKSLIYTQIG